MSGREIELELALHDAAIFAAADRVDAVIALVDVVLGIANQRMTANRQHLNGPVGEARRAAFLRRIAYESAEKEVYR